MFGHLMLTPDKSRKPTYDSENPRSSQNYGFTCNCGQALTIDLPSYIGNYQDREPILGSENSEAIRELFGLRRDRSLIDGWPKFRIEECRKCGKRYLVYIAVFEPDNGWYKIVPQGIVEIMPSNKRVYPTQKS